MQTLKMIKTASPGNYKKKSLSSMTKYSIPNVKKKRHERNLKIQKKDS
jgi:hypothetical protein